MKSIKLQMRDAMEAIEREKLTASDVIGFSVYRLTTANVHVTDDAIIRLYHQMKIARSAVKATAEDGYLHVHFVSRGVAFSACVKLEKAATFIDSKQGQLPASKSKSKHIGSTEQRRLAFAGGGDE
jgi:hypothetical protein